MNSSDDWVCYEILHAVEGERGRRVNVTRMKWPPEAAEFAAEHFERIDMRDQAYGPSEADGGQRFIEVEGAGIYRVICEAVLKYHAIRQTTPIPNP